MNVNIDANKKSYNIRMVFYKNAIHKMKKTAEIALLFLIGYFQKEEPDESIIRHLKQIKIGTLNLLLE